MTRSLKVRLSVILALVLTVSGLTSFLILNVAIAPAFTTLESADARTDLGRSELAIDSQSQQLRAIAGDWAPWDELYSYAEGSNPDFVYRNIDLSTMRNIEIELMQFFDRDGRLLWSGYVEQGNFAGIGGLGRLAEGDPIYAALTRHDGPDSVVAGMLMTTRGPMLLASLPLVVEAGIGPIAGTIVVGRILTAERIANLGDHIKVPFDIIPLDEAVEGMPALVRQLEAAPARTAMHETDDSEVRSYRLLTDLSGEPLGLLQTHTQRDVTVLGQNAANLALSLFVITGLLLVTLIWFLLRRDIVTPLERLAGHMAGIRRSGDLSARIAPNRNDEIGRLGDEFNALTTELQQLRRQLVEQSFKAGRADTAAEVMHNIRNAMTPVVNATEALVGTVHEMAALRLRQAAEELADPACPAERRAGLLRYLGAAADRLEEAGDDATRDVELINRQARLVEDILADQEKVARAAPVQERIDLAEVVNEAAGVLPKQRMAGIDLRVAPELAGLAVVANRVQLIQVIGNVLLNAYESIERAGRRPAGIEVFGGPATEGAGLVRLSIRDDGAGLADEELTQIFRRGYTSKANPQNGLGLHWCANTIRAAGGSIRIESDGPGMGATVQVVLPAAQPVVDPNQGRAAVRPTTLRAPAERSALCPAPVR